MMLMAFMFVNASILWGVPFYMEGGILVII